jgi:hypothetical protein
LLVSPDHSRIGRPGVRLLIRVQAALTAFAFVLSSLIGLIHEATTRHVRCAEHGELMHGDAITATRSAAEAPRHGLVVAGSAVRDATTTAMHAHEHCSLTSRTRDSRVELRPPALVPAPLAISDVPNAAPHVVASRGDSIYRTAPKTSPPA